MADIRGAALELPQMSVMPPVCIAMFRGWFRASKFDFAVPLRVMFRIPSYVSVKEFAANVTLPDFVESYSVILVESCDAISSDIVTFRLPDTVLYEVEDIVGDAVSSWDMADVRGAALELPQMSVMPPACIVTFRGWFRDSKFVFAVPLRVMFRIPSYVSVKEFAANVTLPDFVESYSMILVESCDAMSSDIVTFRLPETVLYEVEDIVGDAVSS